MNQNTATAVFLGLMLLWTIDLSGQTLSVTLLGTGSPIPIVDRFGPSTLIQAGAETLLFDCGRGVPLRLWQLQVPLRNVTAVFFTHLHSDHVAGFPDFWLTGWLPPPFGHRTERLQVYGPTGTANMMKHLQKAYKADIRIRIADEKVPPEGVALAVRDVTEGAVYERNGVKVTAFNVDHGELIKPSFGYRIDYGGHSVVLSGDTRVSENLIRYAKGVDLLVHEVAAADPGLLNTSPDAQRIIGHHTTPEDAGRVFDRVKPKLAVYSHIVLLTTDPAVRAPTADEVLTATRKTYTGPLELGEDLMTIDVGDRVNLRTKK
jgi:ribonuclease Z